MASRANTKTPTKPKPKADNSSESLPQAKVINIYRWLAASPVFAKRYAIFAVLLLLGTTVFWSLQSANLQLSNADQLVNPYLFDHVSTLNGALIPGAHTFLLKWPLFWLVKILGFTSFAYLSITVAVTLITVSGLIYIMYRIERRPLIFGSLCLALASVLLLVPAQPYPGGLLPVNMAMLATRNLEYLLYILSIILIIRARRIKNWRFFLGIACLGLLTASDKLFLIISAGGALIALVCYALSRNWKQVSLSSRWLIAGLGAFLVSVGTLEFLQASRIAHIVSSSGAGPYSLAGGVHDKFVGSIYAVLSIFTIFGANPAHDETVLRNIPRVLGNHLYSLSSFAYLVNAVILLVGLYLAGRLVYISLAHPNRINARVGNVHLLSLVLIWTSLAALFSFVAVNHDFAVDSRYLVIVLFAVFITTAYELKHRQWQPERILLIGLVLFISVLVGLFTSNHTYNDERAALATVDSRNSTIVQALAHRKSKILVGDYWRVIPIKFIASNQLDVMPMSSCTRPRDSLSSKAWQPNLTTHGFVYLLSTEKGLTDYPKCSLKQVVNAYGRPNASALISGSLSNPQELLLFYDRGIHKSSPLTKPLPRGPSTVVPATLSQLPYSPCDVPTIMNVVAHQDDDLLFMNPDLLHDIQAGHCVRTIYITAGDSGSNRFYWLGREQGSEAAYSNMLGIDNIWVQRIVQLTNNEFITIASPRSNSKVSLIFMHLPDGNLKGQGFPSSHNESLKSLLNGKISLMHAVDGQSSYTSAQLTNALVTLMHFVQPTEIRTQANFISKQYPDHSDHLVVGSYTKLAYSQYELQQYNDVVQIPIKFYIGYPVHQMPINVFGKDLGAGEAAYFSYARYDNAVCHTLNQCQSNSTIGLYLARQYQNPN